MRKKLIAKPGKYYASVTGAKDNTSNNSLMVFFDTEDEQGNYMGKTMLFVNDNFMEPKHLEESGHKFLYTIGMLDEDDIDPDTVLQKSKDKKFIVQVEKAIAKDGNVYYNVSDIALRKKKSKKVFKAAKDNE